MSSIANVANAVGAKTARACDSCIKKRARWYCAADDAFLCQACDASVHSANPLARRHERVRLKTASFGSSNTDSLHVASWHRRFTRKARTPRRNGKRQPIEDNNPTLPLVPEVCADEISHEENEEDLLLCNYRVPIYDPFVAELYTSAANSNDEAAKNNKGQESGPSEEGPCCNRDDVVDSCLHGFLPSVMDFAEFAADVESLLGRGLENESRAMEELGLVDYSCREKDFSVKVEEDTYLVVDDDNDECKLFDSKFSHEDTDLAREPYELNFYYDGDASPAAASTCDGDDYQKIITMDGNDEDDDAKKNVNRKILLRLDYEAVSSAWRATTQGSPWTDGGRPDLDPDQCWPDCVGCGTRGFEGQNYPQQVFGELGGMSGHPAAVDGGREARVSRYREKRRTRLFSKKIRYEVRKLNAEKRPRMKGRFVKRASSLTSELPSPAFAVFNKSTN